jgi:GntR family transcriptional regulator/MocR family aminotransferase
LAAEMDEATPVYYLTSLSKTLTKEFQVGLLVLPGDLQEQLRERIKEAFSLITQEPSLLLLDAAARLLQDPWFRDVYLLERRAHFASRWQLVQQEVRQALPVHASIFPIKGGLNTWIQWGTPSFHATSQEKRVVATLREEGLVLTPGYAFRLPEEQEDGVVVRQPAVRFPLSPLDERELRHWLHRLGAALIR